MTPDIETLGKYQLLEELGRGGFATVYRALDTTLDREVALKVLHPQLLVDPSFVSRFQREARAVANLRHPHIVTVYEVGNADGRLFISMELAHGLDLGRAIAERGRIPWPEALTLLQPVCEALEYAHGQKVVHRDLKPANLLIDPERGPLLSDFGFARLMGGSSQSLSLSGEILGTPAYIAPEVWELDAATPAADLYALGCIVFEMLTGQALFTGATPMQAMRSHDRGPQLPQAWPEGVPEGVDEVLRRALAKEPEGRYPSATALWHALSDLEAKAAQEAAERAAVAAQWRAEAESALAAGELSAARVAAGRWLTAAPRDGEARAFAERVRAAERARPRKGTEGSGPRKARKDAEGEAAAERSRRESKQKEKREGAERAAREKAEKQARLRAEEDARRKTEEAAAQRKAEEKARSQAEEKARRKAEGQAQREAKEQSSREAEEVRRRKAEEKARRKAERPTAKGRKVPLWAWAAGGLLLVAAAVGLVLQAFPPGGGGGGDGPPRPTATMTVTVTSPAPPDPNELTERGKAALTAVAVANRQATSTAQVLAARQATSTARALATQRVTETARAAEVTATAAATAARLAAGPASGSLQHKDDGYIEISDAGVELTDFVAEARFYNPYPVGQGAWDYGFLFRIRYRDEFEEHSLRVQSTGEWCHNQRLGGEWGEAPACGQVPGLQTASDASNLLRLTAIGNTGLFWVNDRFVATLDLSGLTAPGSVQVATGLANGHEIDGTTTRFDSFSVWSLDATPAGGPTGPTNTPPKATPTAGTWYWKGRGPFSPSNGALGIVNYTDRVLTVTIDQTGKTYELPKWKEQRLAVELAPGTYTLRASVADLPELLLIGWDSKKGGSINCDGFESLVVQKGQALVIALWVAPYGGVDQLQPASCPWYERDNP